MNFDFNVLAKSVPAICIVSGVALVLLSDRGLGVFLLFTGIILQLLYLFLKYSNKL
jgi:hypothetical protein